MHRKRLLLHLLAAGLMLVVAPAAWVRWGDWPHDVASDAISDPAIVVVLGGDDHSRVREAVRLAEVFPYALLLVTGDSVFILDGLLASGIPESRILVEPAATSTWANAVLSKPWLDAALEGQIVLVTNDFDAPRARAVFRKVYPGRRIVISCETTPQPYNQWQEDFRRRERAAAVYYVLRYRVWSF